MKDTKGNLGTLTYRDFKVYENNDRQALENFSVDPAPLSIAFVIEPEPDFRRDGEGQRLAGRNPGRAHGVPTKWRSLPTTTARKIGAHFLAGRRGKIRLPAVLALAKATGTDEQVPINSSPWRAGASVKTEMAKPNLQPGRSAGNGSFITLPKEIHTLNDAILSAAKELSTRPKERRRII